MHAADSPARRLESKYSLTLLWAARRQTVRIVPRSVSIGARRWKASSTARVLAGPNGD
jgi:hypothetical protein